MSIGKTVALSGTTPPTDTADTRIGALRKAAVVVLPLSAAIGGLIVSVSVGPIELYPFKVLVPALFITSVLVMGWDNRIGGAPGVITALTLWTAVGLVWSIDRGATVQLLSVLVFVVLLFLTLQMIGTGVADALVFGWQLALVVTGLVAVFELATGWHFPTQFVLSRPTLGRTITLSVFNNPNDYGAFLTLAIPLSLFPVRGRTSWFAWILAACSTVFLVTSNSRFALIGLLAIGATALIRRRRGTWGLPTAWSIVLVGATTMMILFMIGASIVKKFAALTAPGAFISSPTGGASSAGDRVGLIANGLWSVVRTGGMGTGGGSFEVFRQNWDLPFFVRPATINPHNMWLEVTTELGLVGLALILLLIGTVYRPVTRRHHPLEPGATVLWAALSGYVFAVATPSSYLKSPVSWMFLGTIYVLARSITDSTRTDAQHADLRSPTNVILSGTLPRPRIMPLRIPIAQGAAHGPPQGGPPAETPIRPMMRTSIGAWTGAEEGRSEPVSTGSGPDGTRSGQVSRRPGESVR